MITRMPPYDIFEELPKIANQVREISEDLAAELDFAVIAMEATFGRAIQLASTGEYEYVPPLSNLEREELDELRRMKMPELFPSTGEANGWISVEERLPDSDRDLLVKTIDGQAMTESDMSVAWLSSGKWESEFDPNISNIVTHWRELPPAPTSVPQAEPPK